MLQTKDIHNLLMALNHFEEALLEEARRNMGKGTTSNAQAMRSYFSKTTNEPDWIINADKLLRDGEMLAIHRHDRFVAFDWHKHDYIEMIYVYAGTLTHKIEDKELELHPGDMLLLDLNVSHAILPALENDIAINILMKREFFDWLFMSQLAQNDVISDFIVKTLYDNKVVKQYLYFKTGDNEIIKDLIFKILGEYFDPRIGKDVVIRSYMVILFTELLRDYRQFFSQQIVHKIDKSIQEEVLTYIQGHYKTTSLVEIAAHFNFNTDYMGKLIKQLTGNSFTALVKEKKLNEAAYLLRHSQLSVVEILNDVGYSNSSYFYKQFKAVYEVTPDEYRKAPEVRV